MDRIAFAFWERIPVEPPSGRARIRQKAPEYSPRPSATATTLGRTLEPSTGIAIPTVFTYWRFCHTPLMRFETTLLQMGNNTGIEVPPEVIEALGGGKRAAVVVDVDGYVFSSTIGAMGGRSLIPFSADKRRATGLSGGEAITVELTLDAAPRTVEVPDDLAAALAEAGARSAFDALAPSARKAHVVNVESAKAADTRARRVAAIVSTLSNA